MATTVVVENTSTAVPLGATREITPSRVIHNGGYYTNGSSYLTNGSGHTTTSTYPREYSTSRVVREASPTRVISGTTGYTTAHSGYTTTGTLMHPREYSVVREASPTRVISGTTGYTTTHAYPTREYSTSRLIHADTVPVTREYSTSRVVTHDHRDWSPSRVEKGTVSKLPEPRIMPENGRIIGETVGPHVIHRAPVEHVTHVPHYTTTHTHAPTETTRVIGGDARSYSTSAYPTREYSTSRVISHETVPLSSRGVPTREPFTTRVISGDASYSTTAAYPTSGYLSSRADVPVTYSSSQYLSSRADVPVTYPSSRAVIHDSTYVPTVSSTTKFHNVDKMTRHTVSSYYRRRLERMFQKYDKSRESEVDTLLREHDGKEPTLIFEMVKKYGEEPHDNEEL